jgi:hypothetical protein
MPRTPSTRAEGVRERWVTRGEVKGDVMGEFLRPRIRRHTGGPATFKYPHAVPPGPRARPLGFPREKPASVEPEA